MDKDLKRQWVEALRSGEYRQTHGSLRRWVTSLDRKSSEDEYGYCCLGVLCEIDARVTFVGDTERAQYRDSIPSQGSLPAVYRLSVGLTTDDEHQLMNLNDGIHADFITIAAWIERHL